MSVNPPANLFKGLKSAKPILDSEYMKPGHYWLLLNRCKVDENRKHESFVANEFTVVHVLDNAVGMGFSVGASATHLTMQKSDYFFSEVRTFVSKVMGVAFEDVGEDEALLVYGPDQPLAGMIVEAVCQQVMTKEGKPFVKTLYRREVPPAEALGILPPNIVSRFFPGGRLEKLAAGE